MSRIPTGNWEMALKHQRWISSGFRRNSERIGLNRTLTNEEMADKPVVRRGLTFQK